jgi:hypothetical protein
MFDDYKCETSRDGGAKNQWHKQILHVKNMHNVLDIQSEIQAYGDNYNISPFDIQSVGRGIIPLQKNLLLYSSEGSASAFIITVSCSHAWINIVCIYS